MDVLGIDIVNPGKHITSFDWTIRPIDRIEDVPVEVVGVGGVPYDLLYMLFYHDDRHKWYEREEYFQHEADDQNTALAEFHEGRNDRLRFSPKLALSVRLAALRILWLIRCIVAAADERAMKIQAEKAANGHP